MLSHVDGRNRPAMVDVGGKPVTRRTAHAIAVVALPPEVSVRLVNGDLATKKGPVFQTAILAGVMGAKRTSDLIPLCHPLPIEDCQIEIEPAAGGGEVVIHCRVRTRARTGVEMEALTGAAVAALTLYDMTKSLSHGIVIREIRLLEKTGGKTRFRAVR
jgi:cyclic pyranopterin monophosphate synthase